MASLNSSSVFGALSVSQEIYTGGNLVLDDTTDHTINGNWTFTKELFIEANDVLDSRLRIHNTSAGGNDWTIQSNNSGGLTLSGVSSGANEFTIDFGGGFEFRDTNNNIAFEMSASGNLSTALGMSVGSTSTTRSIPNEGIEFVGATSSALLGVQDGNGRIQMKWNASDGTSETYLASSEPAFFWDLGITSDPIWEMKYASGGTSGNAISWTTLVELDSAGEMTGTDFIATSDIKLKTDIEQLPNPLEALKNINGVFYARKDDEKRERKIGMIAQNMETEFPELVSEKGSDTKYKAINYSKFTAVLLEATKEQQRIIEDQEERIGKLEKLIEKNIGDDSNE